MREINRAGARLAREVAGDAAYVAGAIGPLGVRIEPWGKTGVDEAREYFREQAAALVEGGVDLLILETFRDWNEAAAAVDAARSACALPIVALVTTEEDGNSLDGTPPEQFGPALAARGADVVGVNCSVGPAPMLETVERLSAVCDVPLSAQPNAGKPRDIEGRNIYLCSPEYMASYARRFIASGVRLVGGCCGTTPEHIRQIALAVKQLAPDVKASSPVPATITVRDAARPAAGAARAEVVARRGAGRRPLRERRGGGAAARPRHLVSRRDGTGAGGTRARSGDGRRRARAAARGSARRRWPRSSSSTPGSSRCSSTRAATATCSASSRTCSARTPWASATCSASPATCAGSATIPTPRRCSTSTRSGCST